MTASLATLARRTTVVVAASAALATLSAPAHADVPEGWSNPESVSLLYAFAVLGGVPVLLFVLIWAAVYLPAMVRGESVTAAGSVDDQWFGGPRQGTSELAGPDNDESKAGGASGRW